MRRLITVLACCSCVTAGVTPSPAAPTPVDDPARLLLALRESASPSSFSRVERTTGAKGDLREVYRKVAPATVLIRAGASYGSGVVFDARGFILTNHHVIARAELVDLKAKVQIQRGALTREGIMSLDERPLTAWVLKSDPLLDLAVLKLAEPPAELASIRLSKRDPSPGEPVAALGHGGIGLLWAIKDGEVASVGRLSTHLASLVGTDCVVESDGTASPACRSAGASVELERKRLEEKVPGLIVQSSCTISPGDSGGPLVNLAGELVGVNAFLKTDPRAGVATNFHVHVAEVRRFLEAVPSEPTRRLPSPWDLVLAGGAWADVDGDGKHDLYTSGTGPRTAFVVNASQRPAPSLVSKMAPDAVLGQVGGQWVGWFDRDGDGEFDRVLLGGVVGQAMELAGQQPGRFLGAASLLDPTLLPSPRWALIAKELEPTIDEKALPTPPEPLAGARELKARDLDGDGRNDVVSARRGAGMVLFIDAMEEALGRPGTLEEQLRAGVAVTVVRQPGRWWIFVGATRVLESIDFITVSRAFLKPAAGELVPAPELGGTDWRGLTLSFLTGQARTRASRAIATLSGDRPAPASRPFPIFGTRARITTMSATALPRAIVTASEHDATTIAFALDGSADESLASRSTWAQDGFPKAGFLWSSRSGREWFQYDTDGDGRVDTVILREGRTQSARRISGDGAISDAPDLAPGRPVRPALLVDPTRAGRMRTLAVETFAPELIEP
ncbi:MAG: trypsin-like peptidase domain-containing protein [Myxococcaceae bacterium]|nr:trypsin-like peptidase domain-containing protein [Myxococcaceae bacterium]